MFFLGFLFLGLSFKGHLGMIFCVFLGFLSNSKVGSRNFCFITFDGTKRRRSSSHLHRCFRCIPFVSFCIRLERGLKIISVPLRIPEEYEFVALWAFCKTSTVEGVCCGRPTGTSVDRYCVSKSI